MGRLKAISARSPEPNLLYNGSMKLFPFIGLIACAALFASCESTETAGTASSGGRQEAKRLAALQQQQQQPPQDEAQQNLENAQQDNMNRDRSAFARY